MRFGGLDGFFAATQQLGSKDQAFYDSVSILTFAATFAPNPDAPYGFDLPNVNHVLKPGHRLMVQVQSSLFPLYDRNPQTYVDNIFFARPGDYRKATQRIWATPGQASFISLPVVSGALP